MFSIQTSTDSKKFELINYLTTIKKELIDDLKGCDKKQVLDMISKLVDDPEKFKEILKVSLYRQSKKYKTN